MSAPNPALEVLRDARARIARPYGWCKGKAMKPEPRADDGWAYCAMGAIRRTGASNARVLAAYRLLSTAAGEYLSEFNDTHTKAEVLAAFDRAIALAGRADG